jgi:hypothetical protein
MDKTRATILAVTVAALAITGVFAVSRALTPGSQPHATTNTQIAQRARQLDRYEASLVRALAKRPPSLPPVPASRPTSISSAAPATVVYRRLPSVVAAGSHRIDDGGERADD